MKENLHSPCFPTWSAEPFGCCGGFSVGWGANTTGGREGGCHSRCTFWPRFFGSSFKFRHLCFLNAWWIFDPSTRVFRHRLFPRWPGVGAQAGKATWDSLHVFRDRRGHFTVHASSGRAASLVVRSSRNFPLRARRRTSLWGDLRLECSVSPDGTASRASPRRFSCVSPFRFDWTGMFSGADAFADELDQEGVDGSDVGTVDEWLSFCDTCFPSVVRVEGFGFIGISVRAAPGGVEVAIPSGVGEAFQVGLASEPGAHDGARGTFAAVNLVELAGPASAHLEPLMELPLELLGFDDSGRPPVPAQLLELCRRQLRLSGGPGRAYRRCRGQESDLKESRRGPSAQTAHAEGRLTAGAFPELVVERLEELSGRPSQLETLGKWSSSPAAARQTSGSNLVGTGRVGAGISLSQRGPRHFAHWFGERKLLENSMFAIRFVCFLMFCFCHLPMLSHIGVAANPAHVFRRLEDALLKVSFLMWIWVWISKFFYLELGLEKVPPTLKLWRGLFWVQHFWKKNA